MSNVLLNLIVTLSGVHKINVAIGRLDGNLRFLFDDVC